MTAAAALAGRLDIRPLHPGDDLDAELDLRDRAFGPVSAAEQARWLTGLRIAVADGRLLGAFDGPRLIGSARFLNMRQFWHGRAVPMAGVAGVKVAPELRGAGLGRALMAALLELIAARGYPVSALYPATSSIYRSLGWELAGAHYETVLPVRTLARLTAPDPDLAGTDRAAGGRGDADGGRPDADGGRADAAAATLAAGRLRRAGPADAGQVTSVLAAVHAARSDSGPVIRDTSVFADWLGEPGRFAYLADDGFVAYRWASGHREILVNRAVAGSAATARAIWSVLASHATMAHTLRGYLAPDDPLTWLAHEADVDLGHRWRWMLRLVDAPGAIAARGFPAAVTARVPLAVTDRQRPSNSGRWLLEVAAGRGTLTPHADGADPGQPGSDRPVALGARGLAALYAGIPLHALRVAGLAAGGAPAAGDALDAAFAADPHMADYF